jgi:hypothetical protein
MRVYIAGPYSQGDKEVNVRRAIDMASTLMRLGHVPFCPHLTHYIHLIHPEDYETWMSQDLEWLSVCDCVIRLTGESEGADREVLWATANDKPVYFNLAEFMEVTPCQC